MEFILNLEASRMRAFAWLFVTMAILSFAVLFVGVPLLEWSGRSPTLVYVMVFLVTILAILIFWATQGKIYLKRKVTFIKTPEGLKILLGQKTFREFTVGYKTSYYLGIEKVNSYTRKMAKRIEIRQNNRSIFISEVVDDPVKPGMRNLEVSDLVAVVPGTIDELAKLLDIKAWV